MALSSSHAEGLDPTALLETCLRSVATTQAATMEANPRGTLRPDAFASGDRRAALTRLRTLGDDGPRLELRGTLGQGGMGVVHLAHQRSMDRLVAVKSVREPTEGSARTARLVHEAMITGALEHPNVVPIYDVCLDEHGAPQVVMRRIDGDPWSELLDHPSRVRAERASADPLEWNLRVLMSVCDALEFAHSRGVIHRDIKPENVMIGRYGEVYLLDWGLAVGLGVEPAGGVAGTPAYMAPEMLGAGGPISAHTDVYLLGAVLFEIIAGHPPHSGETVRELIASVLFGEPDPGDEAPKPLAEIAARAMRRSPSERYPDVGAFRAALAEYLRHRGSQQLATRAAARVVELEEALAGDAPRGRLYELFGECRFGLREALAQWPDNLDAREALDRATCRMNERELADGDARAASVLLAELEAPPEALTAAVEEARRAAEADEARRAELERLKADLDPSVGVRTRWRFAVVAGALWTLLPLLSGFRVHVRGHTMQPWELIVWPIAMGLGVSMLAWFGRRSLQKSTINRNMVAVLIGAMSSLLLSHIGLLMLGLSVDRIQVVDALLWVAMGAAWTAFVDRALWPTVVFFALAFLGCSAWPEVRLFILAACNLACSLVLFWVWRPSRVSSEAEER